jgi:hypothetical protein
LESNASASAAANAVPGLSGAIRVFVRLAEYAIVSPTVMIGVVQAASDEILPNLIERG